MAFVYIITEDGEPVITEADSYLVTEDVEFFDGTAFTANKISTAFATNKMSTAFAVSKISTEYTVSKA